LRSLKLQDNQLTGAIPAGLGNLNSLENLWLQKNQLTGTIPVELGGLTNLVMLFVSENQLTGTVPTELGNLTSLAELGLGNNLLTGAIPSALGNLNLGTLNLEYNQLTGSIPPELGNHSGLSWLILGHNQLTGTIPVGLGNLLYLEYLDLRDNHLNGSLPAEIGDMQWLDHLWLNSNGFSGEIPSTLVNTNRRGDDSTIAVDYNALFTSDPALVEFLDLASAGEWRSNQTVAPHGMSAVAKSANAILVSWTPIAYTGDTGGYLVYSSTVSGGPYTLAGTTVNKSASSCLVSGLTGGTPYYFVVRTRTDAHAKNSNTVTSDESAEVSATTVGPLLPTVITSALTDITYAGATGGGNVTAAGDFPVSSRGLCWSMLSAPTLADAHTVDGSGIGVFSCQLTGLSPATTYHARSYATSSAGTVYGNEVTFATLERPNVVVTLQGTRKSEKAWILTRYYGELQVTVANPGSVPVAAYVLRRRTGGGSWEIRKEIAPGLLQGGNCTSFDRYLEKGSSYTYRVEAVDASGTVLAVSGEVNI
jgi:hypothetical protein